MEEVTKSWRIRRKENYEDLGQKQQSKGPGAGSLSFWEDLQGFELVAPAFDVEG